MSGDLASWLLEQIAADEDAARAAQGRWPSSYTEPFASEVRAVHIARWDPARVLAECEAKRHLVAFVGDLAEGDPVHGLTAKEALRLLAVPYADREGYRPEWRP